MTLVFFCAVAQDLHADKDFRTEIDRVYNFHPRKLNKEQQQAMIPKMDSLFTKILADTAKYLPALREELAGIGHVPYFYFDGASLLFSVSKSPSDVRLCAQALVKSNTRDVPPRTYLTLLRELTIKGADITPAAMKIVADTSFRFIVDEHAMVFGRGYCLTYALLPLQPHQYIDSLIMAFGRTKLVDDQTVIIDAIWFSNTCKGDEFLRSRTASNSLTPRIADYAKNLLGRQPDEVTRNVFKGMSDDKVLTSKRAALMRFSDEAIGELDMATKEYRARGKCR